MLVDRFRTVPGNAELVLGFPGRNLGMRERIDVRIDAQRHRRALRLRDSNLAQDLKLFLALGIELHDAAIEPERDLLARLADAREHDLRGRHAASQRTLELTGRHDVGACAKLRQRPDDGKIAIRLDRIGDQRALRQRRFEHTIVPFKRGGGIAIKGRAHARRYGRDGDIFGVEFAVFVFKVVQGSRPVLRGKSGERDASTA